MAAPNITPIYSKAGQINWGAADGDGGTAGPLKTANTAKDGTGTTLTIFTADATNGGRIERLVIRAAGTNVATVLRVWVNNGSSSATIANNMPLCEITCAATTLSEVAALADPFTTISPNVFPLVLPAGYKLICAIGTTVSAGLRVGTIGGVY